MQKPVETALALKRKYPEQVVLVCFTIATYQIHPKILKEALP